MKIALGMMIKNEAWILEKTLPTIANQFQYKYALDLGSSDNSVEILKRFGFKIFTTEYDQNFADMRNDLIKKLEAEGMEAVFMLDADESMWPEAIDIVKRHLETYPAVILPRIEFVRTPNYYDSTFYPDFQTRVFRLNQGFYFQGKMHELLVDTKKSMILSQDETQTIKALNCDIYHYGRTKDLKTQALKYLNYARHEKDEKYLAELPEDHQIAYSYWNETKPYPDRHPLSDGQIFSPPTFTHDWFSNNIGIWLKNLAKFINKPDLSALEVGCYEGRSTVFLLESILCGKKCHLDVIDTFQGSFEHSDLANVDFSNTFEKFKHNIAPFREKVTIMIGESQLHLRHMQPDKYDLMYIDGSHVACDVMIDLILAFPLLKQGGVMIMDDYMWDAYEDKKMNPRMAIDAFLEMFEGQYKLLHKEYQVIIEKV